MNSRNDQQQPSNDPLPPPSWVVPAVEYGRSAGGLRDTVASSSSPRTRSDRGPFTPIGADYGGGSGESSVIDTLITI